MNKLWLEGKTAIVTGASEGIGYAISELFVEEGANVVMISRREDVLKQAADEINAKGLPGKALAMQGDVTDETLADRAFALAIETFGDVDILVNNAGRGDTSAIETTTNEQWDDLLALNLRGPFMLCRKAAQHFIPKDEGVIVNVSSINGLKPGNGVAYTSSKGALNTLTRNMAIRFAGTGIRINALCPGLTESAASRAFVQDKAVSAGGNSMRKYANHYINESFDGMIPARDMAYGALFLACDMSRCMTGQNLVIEKGRYFN